MNRWKPRLPRYNIPIVIKRNYDGPASRVGAQKLGSTNVRVLRRFDKTTLDNSDLPSVSAPSSLRAEPGNYSGWVSWWPRREDSQSTDLITDPPQIDRTLDPNSDNPILWEAYAEVGTSVWSGRISAVFAWCDWVPQSGSQKMSGVVSLAVNSARVKIRPEIVRTADISAISWDVLRLDDRSTWKLEAVVPSYRRAEFVELMLEKVEK